MDVEDHVAASALQEDIRTSVKLLAEELRREKKEQLDALATAAKQKKRQRELMERDRDWETN